MKTRNGFVSNSSSSSFVVIRKDFHSKKEKSLLTPKEENLLIDYGFKKVGCFCANQVDCELNHEEKRSIVSARKKMYKKLKIKFIKSAKDDDSFNYGYSITCNQDEVIYFLLKNNISFEGDCHYGDYNVVYKKGQKYFLRLQNYGVQCRLASNYETMLERIGRVQKDPVEKIDVKEWLKKEQKWRKEYENT